MVADYHTHTRWCYHATGEISDYVKAAIATGLEEIAITEHVPHRDNQDSQRIQWQDFEEYNEELDRIVEEYKDKIKVIKGFECEYYPESLEDYKIFKEQYGYNLLILGQHRSNNRIIDNFVSKGSKELLMYGNEICEGLETGFFKFLAHPDLAVHKYINGWDSHCEKVMRMIFKTCEKLRIPVEINANGLRMKMQYPSRDAFQLSKEYQLTYLINGDSHMPEYIYDESILKAEEMAKSLGIEVMQRIIL